MLVVKLRGQPNVQLLNSITTDLIKPNRRLGRFATGHGFVLTEADFLVYCIQDHGDINDQNLTPAPCSDSISIDFLHLRGRNSSPQPLDDACR